jgi:hypothetical protein
MNDSNQSPDVQAGLKMQRKAYEQRYPAELVAKAMEEDRLLEADQVFFFTVKDHTREDSDPERIRAFHLLFKGEDSAPMPFIKWLSESTGISRPEYFLTFKGILPRERYEIKKVARPDGEARPFSMLMEGMARWLVWRFDGIDNIPHDIRFYAHVVHPKLLEFYRDHYDFKNHFPEGVTPDSDPNDTILSIGANELVSWALRNGKIDDLIK